MLLQATLPLVDDAFPFLINDVKGFLYLGLIELLLLDLLERACSVWQHFEINLFKLKADDHLRRY